MRKAVWSPPPAEVKGYKCGVPEHRCFERRVWESGFSGDFQAGGATLAGSSMVDSSVSPTERSGQRVRPKKVTQGSQGAISSIRRVTFEPFLCGSREGPKPHGSPWGAVVGPQLELSRAGGASPAQQSPSGSGSRMPTGQGCRRQISCHGGWLEVQTGDLWHPSGPRF